MHRNKLTFAVLVTVLLLVFFLVPHASADVSDDWTIDNSTFGNGIYPTPTPPPDQATIINTATAGFNALMLFAIVPFILAAILIIGIILLVRNGSISEEQIPAVVGTVAVIFVIVIVLLVSAVLFGGMQTALQNIPS